MLDLTPIDTLERMPERVRFSVRTDDIFDISGKTIDPEIARGVYRTDTNELLATCGARYTPIQHHQVLDPVVKVLTDSGYDIIEREVTHRSLYDLKGKKGAFIQTDLDRSGARMKTTIIVGDFIDPVPEMFRSPEEREIPPTCFREYAIFNSHDGSLAARIDPGYKVLRCLNGIRSTSFSTSIKSRHTSGFSLDSFKRQIEAAANLMENDSEKFELYARTKISEEQARVFLKKTLALKYGDFDREEDSYSKPLLDKIMTRFMNHESSTVWGLYMAMTWHATHDDVRTSSSEMMARIRRDEGVARAMRSPQLDKLIAA